MVELFRIYKGREKYLLVLFVYSAISCVFQLTYSVKMKHSYVGHSVSLSIRNCNHTQH